MKRFILLLSLLICSILAIGCFNKVEVTPDNIPDEITTERKYFSAIWTEPYRDLQISDWIAKFSSPMYDTNVEVPVNIRKEWENYYFSWEELEGEFIKKDCIDWWKWDLHYYTVWVAKFREYYYEWCGDDEKWIKISDEDHEKGFSNFIAQYSGNVQNCEKDIINKLTMISENASGVSYSWYNYLNLGKSYKVEWYISYSINDTYHTKDITCAFQSTDFSDWWENWNWKVEYRWYWNILWLARNDKEQACIDSLDQYGPEQMNWHPDTIISIWCWAENYWEYYITWYIYTTTYHDLWIRISTPDGYDTFLNKSDIPIFTRSWNRISYFNNYNWKELEYLQVFEKSESESLKDIISDKHLNEWCVINENNYFQQKTILWPYPWILIYDIFDESGSLPWKCIPDDEDISWKNIFNPVMYFESPDKTKYYKLVITDWCAPWPCSMFGEVELL